MAEFDENHRKWAYDELSKTTDAGTYDEFKEAMKNPDNRKWAYGELSKMNDLGTQEDFDNAIMEPVSTAPTANAVGTVAEGEQEGTAVPEAPAANAAGTVARGTSVAERNQPSFGENLKEGFSAAVNDAAKIYSRKIYSRGQGMMPGTEANASGTVAGARGRNLGNGGNALGTVAGAKMNENILSEEEEQRMRENFERTGQYFPQTQNVTTPLMSQEEKSELAKTWEDRMNESPMSQWGKEQILKMRDEKAKAEEYEKAMDSIAVPASVHTDSARQAAWQQFMEKAKSGGATDEQVQQWLNDNGLNTPEDIRELSDLLIDEDYRAQNQYVGKTLRQLYNEPMEALRKALAEGREAGSKAAGEYLQQNQVIGGTNVPGATMYHTIEASKRYNAEANSEKAVGAALDKATQIAQSYGMDKSEFTKQILGQAYSELIASKMPQSAIENIIVNGVKQSITGQIVSATVNNEFDRMLDQMAQSAYDENVGIPESVLKGIVSFVSDSWMYMGGGATAGTAASASMKKIIGKRIAQKLIDGGMRRGIAEATAQRAIAMMPTLGQKMAIGGAHGAGTFGAIGAAEGAMQGTITPGQMRNAEAVGQRYEDINPADYRLNYQSASEEERKMMMTPEEQEKLFNGAKGTRSANEAIKGGIFGMAGGALFQGAPIADVIFRGARGVVGAMGRSLTQAGVNTGAMTAQQTAEMAYEGGEAWDQFDVTKAAAQNFGTILGLEARSIYSNVRNFRQMDNYNERLSNLNRELKASPYKSLTDAIAKLGMNVSGAYDVEGKGMKTVEGKHSGFSAEQVKDIQENAYKAIASGALTQEGANTLMSLLTGQGIAINPVAQVNVDSTENGVWTVNELDASGETVRTRQFKTKGQALAYQMKVQHAADVEAAGVLEAAVNQANALENARAFVDQAYNGGVAEKVEQYNAVRDKYNQWFAVKEKSDRGGYLTREEEMLLKNPPAFTAEEQSIIDNAPTDMERDIVDAYNLQQGGNATGPGVAAYRNIISKMVGDSNYSAEFASNYEAENGLEPNSVLNAYRPLTAEERDAWVEAHPDEGAPHKYGDGFSTPEMDNIRRGYEKAMKDYVKNARSTYEGETEPSGEAEGTGAGTSANTSRIGAGALDAKGTVAGTEGETSANASGTVTETSANASGTVAGVDGAGGENLTPQQKAQEEAKQKAQMAQMRGAQIVGNDDRQGASDLRLEHETAKARVQRVFAEGSQNALTAADVMNMADSGRAQAAYQYLNDKRGELTEAQASALDQYIGAQTSVNAMQESIAQGVRDQITAHGNTMTQLMGEDGQLTRVQVMPMGNQRIMQTAYVKSGSLTNKYGAPTIMVTYVTTDENGEPVIGNTMQIAKSRVALNSAVTEGYDEHMAQYEQDVTNNVGIMWERRSQGLDYHAGDVVPIRMNNTEAKVVVLGEDQQGNVILGDASQPDNEMLKMSMPRQIFETAVSSGRENVIQQTLTSEASKQIQEQRRAKQSAIDAKRKADIVGYDRGMIRKENGGTVDLTHKDTKPKTAAEYLVEMEGSNEAAVDWVEAQKVRLAAQEETLLTQRHDETQWIGAYGGQDNPEEADHQRRLMNIDERLQEVSRQYQKLNDIKTYAMSTEMKQRLMKERGEVILAEQKKAAQKYQKAESQRNDKYLPVDAEGEIRLGLVDASAARNYLTNNYRSFMEADEYLRGQFERIDNEGRRQRSNLDTQKSRLQAYREGREDLDGMELRQIVEAERRAQNEIDLLMAERTGLNRLDKQLETLYAEELAREWSEDPQKGRTERINRRKTDNAKLEQARKEYKDYPEAMVILDQGLEPQTLEEYVSMIGLGALSWEGYGVGEHHVRGLQEEIGKNMTRSRFGKRGDTYAFDYMLAKKAENGKGIDEISHSMAEDTPWTPEEVKRAILDMLMNASKPDDIRSYIIRNRLEAAETAARHQDEAELAAAEEAEWQARNAGTEVETSGTVAGAEDPFAGGGAEGLYDNYDFSLDSQELIDKHNERAKQDGGLISNDGSKSLTLGMASLLDRVGNQVGRTIRIATADEIWNALTPAQQKVFGGKEGLKRLGAGYNDPKNNQLVMNGAYLASRNDPAEVVRVVLGHELTHIIKAMNSPEVWNTYVELVKNALGENVFNHNLNLVRRRYEGMPGYTGADKEQKFIEEVCANYAGDNKFTSDRDIQKLVDAMDAYGVDMSAFTDTVRRILDMLNDLEDMARQLNDEGLLSDFDVEDVKDVKQEALDTWDQMYKTAVEKVEAKKAASVKEPSGKAEGTVADGQIRDLVPSQKKDAQGNAFYERNGNIDLWEIDELLGKAGRQKAPVRLTDRNVKHILESHNKEFKGNAENVIDFIDDVFDGANILRKAKGRAMFVVVENTNNDKVAVIKMFPSEYGDYYNIDTIGYYRKNKWKKEEEIIGELSEPAPSESASNPSKPQAPNNSGKEPLNAKGQLSGGKVTNNSGNDQINQRKNAENQPKTAENDVQWALQPLEERVSGWALEDAQDLIADVRSVGGEVDDNGVVTVYHRTNSPEAVRSILSSGVMKTKEPAVFFSTHQKGSNNYGYGNWGVKLRIPAEKLQVDDVFTDELTLKMPLKGYKADVRQYLAEDNSDVQWALDVAESAPWLSNAAVGLEKIKQEKATGEQWVKMLQKNGGLKAEEDKWIGLSEWLMDQREHAGNGGKERQAEIIRKSNPKDESLGEHTWITSADDILTFDEALKDFSGTPDYTLADAEKAQKTGKIKVYSSYPIKNGNFVTPSRMEAENYAGEGTVYEKVVNVNDVAWIDSNQGQMAVVDNTFTKAQVRQFIEENAVKIEDVKYGQYGSWDKTVDVSTNVDDWKVWHENPSKDMTIYKSDRGGAYSIIRRGNEYQVRYIVSDKGWPFPSLKEAVESLKGEKYNEHEVTEAINGTRLTYTTDGLRNKREIAMVMPGIEPYNRNDEVHFGDAGEGRAVAWVRFGDAENVVTETSADEGALQALSNAKKAFDDFHKKLEEKYGTTELLELASKMSREDNAEWNRLDEEVTKANEAVNKTKRNKVLVMDEVQSKRHQDGRENGYARKITNPYVGEYKLDKTKGWSTADILNEDGTKIGTMFTEDGEYWAEAGDTMTSSERTEEAILRRLPNIKGFQGVPDAPFRKNWHEIGMKRMLRYAAENGYDKLAWTTGTQQAERYGLGGTVETIRSSHRNGHNNCLVTLDLNGGNKISFFVDKSTEIISETVSGGNADVFNGQRLSQVVGSEIAHKLLEGNAKLSGNNLSVGGEGMKGFYDQMLVKFMDKYCKKWGVKVQDVELDLPNSADRVMHSVDITPEMKDEILDGQLMWMLAGEIGVKNLDEASKEKMQKEDGKKTIDNMQNLALANVLEKRGAEALDIKRATGWEKGKDGKWRLELPDMRLRVEPDGENHTVIELDEGETLRLGDIVEEDNGLFEAYPELADVEVNGDAHGSTMGSYNSGTNVLSLNVDDLNNVFKSLENTERSLSRFDAADDEERKMILELADVSSEKLYKERLEARKSNYEGALEIVKAELVETIAHEVQHYIQHVEGFAAGGNMQMDAPESLKAERREAYELELKALREELDAKEEAANKAEDAMREAHRKYNEYVYVEDKEFGGMAFSKVLSESEKGRELYADYRRLYDAFDKAYDEEIAVSRKIRDIQDAIDAPLGRAGYQRLAGEVEARAVGARTFMTPQQRRETLARSSEDVERERQIVIQDMKPSRAESARTEANASGTVAGARGRSLGNSGEAMSQWLTERDRTVADAEGVNWMLGEVRMRGDVTTEANLEAWEKAKNAYPDKVVVMQDGQGYVTFRDDARKMSEAIGKVPEENGVLRLNYGEYVTAQDKLGDVVDEAQWSGFEEWPGVDDSAWVDGKVRGKDAKAFVNGHPELRRLRKNIAKAYDGNGNIEGAVEDYRQALQGMMDGEREDIKVLKGAQRVMLEQLSELNDIEKGKKAPVFDVEAEPAPKAKGTKRGTKANALGTVAGTEGEASGTVARKARGKKTAEPKGKTQKEWQKTAPSDEDIVKNIWADPESMEHTTGEYYEGDNQALAHAIKRGETGAIKEAARRMALYIQYHYDDMHDGVQPVKEHIQQYERENTVLVPVPSHGGKATYTLKLAKELSKRTGIPVVNALHCEPYESSYDKKAHGEKPEVPEMEMSDDYDAQMDVRDAKTVMLIDNVEATGNTMFEAEVGISGYTHGSIYRFPFVKDNSKTLPLGEKTVSLRAEEASRVRWQARELPMQQSEQPWKDVKKASVHTSNIRKRLPQTYYAAKHGDVKAAHELVTEVVKPHVLVRIAVEHPDAMVAYPHYESTEGSNAIPAAYAQMFERYGLTVDTEIVQRNRVHRTDATRYDRLMNRARFAGDVIPGQEYILVDDHITSGATLRDMKDYIESEGGVVVAWSALEGSAGSTNVEITEENKTKLKELGVTDEQVQELGISRTIDNLTNAEARELASLAKRGRDFRSKAQQEEHARAVKGTEPTRQGTRADKRAAEAESRRLRERAEAEKRFEDLRREQERFVKLFGEMPAEAPLETREGTEADASGTVAGTEVETSGTVAELVSGGRYVDVSGIRPEVDTSGTVAGTVAAEWDAQIKAAREAVNGNPTDGQKEAGNYKKGHVRLDGLNISIENAKGSTRSGRDADGKEWSVTMHYDYGDIRGRVGVDGDNIDVYLSDRPYEGYVFVIDQVDPKTGEFDEHKVMYGFNSEEEAREAYLSNYEKGWKGLGDITGVGKNYFKEWLQSSRRKRKPFKEYVNLPRVKHPDSGMTERGRQEVARIQREMYEMYLAEADRLIEEEKKRSIEERYGRFPGDPVSLRDRGIWLTPKQRESLKNMVNYTYKVLNRQNETGRSGGWNMLGAYPGKPMWYPENVDDTEEALAEAQREKEAAQGNTEKAASVETSMGVEEEKPEVPFVLTPEETPAAAKARIRRENARRRVKARLNGEEVPAEAPLGTVAGTEGKASGMVAGMPARVEADGQTALWESGPDTGSDMTMDDVMNLQWQMGTNAQRPRRKKGESDFAYISRVAAWEVQQQKLASAPPAPNQEDIEQRWNGQYEQDHASWVERHDLGELMTSEPKRGDYDSVDEYADALREWEKQSAARADADDPEPQAFDYMVKAQDEYRDAYAQWQRDNDIHEEGEGTLSFSPLFTGEVPQPKTVVGKNVETGEEVEMPADEVLAAEVAESQAVLRDLGEAAGINVDARGARRAAHVAIVDRQARLGMMRSEDAVFIHELEGDIKTAAKELGMKANELNKMLPFIIESPTRLTEIVEATYFDMRKHPLDFYTVKHLLPQIFSNEVSEEALVSDIHDVMRQALEGGGDAELAAAMRHYELQRSPELRPLLDKVASWYDAYFTTLEENGLNRNDAHRVTDYVNHDWDMVNSDQRAIDTWKNMARTTSKNMKQREIMTLAKGIEIGLKPKYETLTGMMGSYSNKNTEAIANRKFLDDLSGLCCNLYNTDGEVINVLSLLSSEEPMMMIKDNYTEFEVPGVGKVWVLKDAEGAFTTIFGDKGLKGHQTLQNIWDGWLTTNGAMKMIQLSLSGFHALALTEAAFAQNPLLCAKSVMSYILYSSALKAHERPAFAHPEDMKDAAAHLVQLGATNDYASAEVRKFTRSMRDKMTEWATKSDKSRLSGIGKTAVGGALFTPAFIADVVSTGMDTMLWEYVHDGLKTSYYKHYAAQVRKKSQREGWDEERTERQLMNVGQYVNDIFGGQHWSVIGITPLMERILRTMMLSPDWNWSTTRQAMSVFGLGGVYSDNNLLRYITERVKNKGKKPQEDLYWEVDKDGAKFRAKRGWEMLAGVVLMTALYNVWNVVNRMSDEEKEFKKADEIRHKTPGYLSPYELQYPYGMKWYDYTMWGNSLNRRSRLFLGRGDDGVERYARFGKQFQELPDYFEGEYGFEFPGPLIKRLRTKQSPMLNLWDSLTDFWGASPNGKMSTESEQLRKRYGNAVGTLSLVTKNVIPFSMSGDWDDKTITEFFMPVGKGFSKWKAKKGFEHFIANDDWNGIDMVIRSCQLNGIEPEPIFENALSSIETMARDERMEGVTDLKTAMEAFNATSNLKDRNTLKRKMAKYMTQQNYRRFTIEEARERVDQKLSGEDDVTAGISDVQKNIYLKTMTAEDCRDEIIITKANAAAKDIKQKAKAMAQNGNTTFAKKHAKEIGVAKTISSYRTAMNKLKKTLGNGNDEAVMEKIRKLRKELVEKVNEAR